MPAERYATQRQRVLAPLLPLLRDILPPLFFAYDTRQLPLCRRGKSVALRAQYSACEMRRIGYALLY